MIKCKCTFMAFEKKNQGVRENLNSLNYTIDFSGHMK